MIILKLAILICSFISVLLIVSLLSPFFQKFFENWQKKRVEKMTPKLDNMFLNVPIPRIVFFDVLSPLVLGGAAFLISQNILVAAIGAVFGLALPLIVVAQMEKARRLKFSQQLIDGLMVLSGSLRAGLSLLQSFEVLVEELPGPISQEFSLVLRENKMGVALEVSLTNLKKRMPIEELDLIITAILVARETGGDLTETFTQLVFTIRERTKLLGRVKALTVQAKLQGLIMGILPIAFAGFVYMNNPHFFDIMLSNETGRFLLILAVVLEALGVFFIRKFSQIDI